MINQQGKHSQPPQVSPSLLTNGFLRKLLIAVFVLTITGIGAATCLFSPWTIIHGGLDGWAKGENPEAKVDGWVGGTEVAFNQSLFCKESFIDCYGFSEYLLGRRFIRDMDYSYSVVKDNSDILQFIAYEAAVPEIITSLGTYADIGTPILYVQPPTKFMAGFTDFPLNLNDKSEENTNKVLKSLEEQGVAYLDLRQAVAAENLDRASLFYRTDHHWTTQTAFWAMGKTVDYLRTTMAMDLDPNHYYTDINNFESSLYEASFLGSQGRRVGRYYAGVDDFTMIKPNFATDYEVSYIDDYAKSKSGDFSQTIVEPTFLKTEASVYTNRYAAYFGGDHSKVVIDNKKIDSRGKRVLVIKDSYGLPYCAYLSTMVDQLVMLDLRYYSLENLRKYMEENQFDLLIVMFE